MQELSSTSSCRNKTSKRRKRFKWTKNKLIWYCVIILSILIIYGLFNPDTAVRLIEAFVKAMGFVITI